MIDRTLGNLNLEGFHSKESFELFIEKSKHDFDNSYIDTLVNLCETNYIDYEDLKGLISTSLKLKITQEASTNKQLKSFPRSIDCNQIF